MEDSSEKLYLEGVAKESGEKIKLEFIDEFSKRIGDNNRHKNYVSQQKKIQCWKRMD